MEILESRDILDRTPLMALFSHGFASQVENLLEKYPTINLLEKNKYGESCLYFAIKNRQWALLKILSKRSEIANRGVYSSKHTCLFQYLNTMSLNEDVEFYEKLWENTGLKPQVDILGQSLMGYEPPLGLMGMS
jgi:ankyrin repeat protein